MNIIRTCFAFTIVICAGFAHGDSIYKWVDENGVTHYSSGAPQNTKTQQVKVQPPSAASENAAQQPSMRQWETDERMKNGKQRREQQEAAEQQLKAEKAEQCEIARHRLGIMLEQRRIYSTNENGEREYWDDNAREDEIRKAREAISKNC